FRVSVAPPGGAGPDRAAELADLLARDEAIGEGTIETVNDGWRIVQGDDVLHVQQSPLRFSLFRNQRLVLEAGTSDVPAIAHVTAEPDETDELHGPDVPTWRLHFALGEDEGMYGLGESQASLDRRGECIVSDDPAASALPLGWS